MTHYSNILMSQLNLDCVEVDRYKKQRLCEYLEFKLSRKQPLSPQELQQIIGMSQRQLEILRSNNVGKLQWKIE